MDDVDSALVELLQADASTSNKELARRLHIAESTCLERVRSLRRRGVVTGHHAEIDLAELGRSVQALIAVRLRPPARHVIDAFQTFVLGLPETIGVFVTTGPDDFLIHIAVPDVEHMNAFVLDTLTERREIVDVRTSVIFRHHRKRVVSDLTGPGR